MQLTRFWADGRERFGLAEDDSCIDLSGVVASFADLATLAMQGPVDLTGPPFPLSAVTRLIPLTGNYRVFCAALNYLAHAGEVGLNVPKDPLIFFKLPDSMINPDSAIPKPAITDYLDYEGELAVVIGRSGRNIPENEALDYVLGYAALNEVSARDLQKRKQGDRITLDWFSGKALDGIAPIGPYVVTADAVADPADFQLGTWLNGEQVQNVRTSKLIFSVPRLINYISQRVMLKPFDVIATGTPGGVGESFDRRLVPGDMVEVRGDGVGTLRNTVV